MSKKVIKIGLVIFILFISFIPLGLCKDKYKHGKIAEFDFTYEVDLTNGMGVWDNAPAEFVAYQWFEGTTLLESGFTDNLGLLTFTVKRNVQYTLKYFNDGNQEIIVENPETVESIVMKRIYIDAQNIWLMTIPPIELTNVIVDLYHWNPTLSTWDVVMPVLTTSSGSAVYRGLILGTYSFDQITEYVLTSGMYMLEIPLVEIEPILSFISKGKYKIPTLKNGV